MLDPSQFVRVAGGGAPAPASIDPGAIPTLDSYGADPSSVTQGGATGQVPGVPSMSLNPRLPGADTTGQETLDSEGSFTSH